MNTELLKIITHLDDKVNNELSGHRGDGSRERVN